RHCELAGDLQRLVDRDRAQTDPVRQSWPLDELEHERADSLRVLYAVDCRDVRMIQRGEELRLPCESCDAICVDQEGFWQDLDGDVTIDLRAACPVPLTHSADAKGRQDLIGAEAGTAWNSHPQILPPQRSRFRRHGQFCRPDPSMAELPACELSQLWRPDG